MRKLSIFVGAIICFVDLSSCSTTSFAPPPVTAELARAETRQSATGRTRGSEHADLTILREGRTLFVSPLHRMSHAASVLALQDRGLAGYRKQHVASRESET